MSDFIMPSMGADMDSATLVEWKVKPGDRVKKGQVIAAVETSKGALDVEVFEDGVVEEIYVPEDTEADVGTPLARIGDGKGVGKQPSEAAEKAEPTATPEAEKPPTVEQPPVTETPAPTASGTAIKSETRHDQPEPTPPSPPPSPPAAEKTDLRSRVWASPAARRRARKAGIPLSGLHGTGPDNAIVLRDLQDTPSTTTETRPGTGFDRPQMRAAIAAAMSRAKREIPHYYLATTADLHAAEQWLADYNQHQPPENRLLLSALFMKATALALARYPELNGHYDEDGFIAAARINLGMAVHLRGGGLVAPAILDADTLTLPELMHRLRDLVRRARGGGLRASEMGGGTATVTALGDRGVDTVYGVIYPPQVAMIGIGRARRRPLAVDDGVAVRLAVDLSLAADHRVCDGHLGALFLNEMDQLLQQPEAL